MLGSTLSPRCLLPFSHTHSSVTGQQGRLQTTDYILGRGAETPPGDVPFLVGYGHEYGLVPVFEFFLGGYSGGISPGGFCPSVYVNADIHYEYERLQITSQKFVASDQHLRVCAPLPAPYAVRRAVKVSSRLYYNVKVKR